MRFRQREGSDLARRVLRCDDEERLRQPPRLTVYGHLPLLHRLQERTLRLGCRAIDLIGKHQLGKNGTRMEPKPPAVALEYGDPDHVRREQVARKLNSGVLEPQQSGEQMCQGGLADTWEVLDQQVPAGEEAGQRLLEFIVLSQDDGPRRGQHPLRHQLRRHAREASLPDRLWLASDSPAGRQPRGEILSFHGMYQPPLD